MRSVKFLSDEPLKTRNDDFFKVHTQIAETISRILKSIDVSKGAFSIGLYGRWGSGKSTIVNILTELLDEQNQKEKGNFIIPLYLDIWKYQNYPLDRAILFEMEKEFKKIAKKERGYFIKEIAENFKEYKYKYKENDKEMTLKEALYYEAEFQEVIKVGEEEVKGAIERTKSIFSLRDWRTWLFIVLPIFWAALALIIPLVRGNLIIPIILLAIAYILSNVLRFFGPSIIELLGKIVFRRTIRDLKSKPAFSAEQFENIFKDMVRKARGEENKLLIIFDNIDRCPPDISYEMISTIKTFMDVPGCVYIIPCDDSALRKHVEASYKGRNKDLSDFSKEFLDKFFQLTFRIPPLLEQNRDEFIDRCLSEMEIPVEETDKKRIREVLTLAYKGQTPRQIKRFLNDFALYYLAALNIEETEKRWQEERVLTKDMGLLAFMVALKQIWPKMEDELRRQPDLLHRLKETSLNENEITTDLLKQQGLTVSQNKKYEEHEEYIERFCEFLNSALYWIELPNDITPFIYLKPSAAEEILTGEVLDALRSGREEYWEQIPDEKLSTAVIKANDLMKGWIKSNQKIYLQNAVRSIWLLPKRNNEVSKKISDVFLDACSKIDIYTILKLKKDNLDAFFDWIKLAEKGRKDAVLNRFIDIIPYKEEGNI